MVERPIRIREVAGSMPAFSTFGPSYMESADIY